MNLQKFIDELIENRGCTYSVNSGTVPEVGYFVSVKDSELTIDRGINDEADKAVLKKAVKEFLLLNAEALASEEAYLGGWIDDNKIYLDVTLRIMDKQLAGVFAIEQQQKAIYDMTEGRVLYLDKYGRLYEETAEGKIYESQAELYDDFHTSKGKQSKKIF